MEYGRVDGLVHHVGGFWGVDLMCLVEFVSASLDDWSRPTPAHHNTSEMTSHLYGVKQHRPIEKTSSCISHTLDISTKLAPLYLPLSLPSNEPYYISLALLSPKLPYLAILFIHPLVCNTSRFS